MRAGRDLPYPASTPERRLVITEGAIRELVRRTGDGVEGVLTGRCRIFVDGDSAQLRVGIAVIPDRPLHDIAREVRAAIAAALARETPFATAVVDVEIEDVIERRPR